MRWWEGVGWRRLPPIHGALLCALLYAIRSDPMKASNSSTALSSLSLSLCLALAVSLSPLYIFLALSKTGIYLCYSCYPSIFPFISRDLSLARNVTSSLFYPRALPGMHTHTHTHIHRTVPGRPRCTTPWGARMPPHGRPSSQPRPTPTCKYPFSLSPSLLLCVCPFLCKGRER